MAHQRVGFEHAIRIGDVIGRPVIYFIPTGSKFVAHAGFEGKIGRKADGVLEIPRAKQAPPAKFGWVRDYLEAADCTLEKCCEAGETGLPQPARSGVFV